MTPRPSVEEAVRGDLRPIALVRATPAALWGVVALFVLLGTAYALAVPLLHAPDEGAHVDRIAVLDGQFGIPADIDLRYSPDLVAAYAEVGIVPVDHRVLPRSPWVELDTANAVPRGQRSPYAELAPPGETDYLNAAGSHPPAYYATIEALDDGLQLLGAGAPDAVPWDALVLRWRLLSLLLVAALPWLAFWTARRVHPRPAVAWTAATLTLALPQLSHAAGAVNNDSLLFLACAVASLAAVWIATGDRSWRTPVLAGVAAGVGVLAKVFALGAPLWILVAVVLAWRIGHLDTRAALGRLGAAALATVAAGGWWPLLALARFGTLAPRDFAYPEPTVVDVDVVGWLHEATARLSSTGLGKFGIEQFPLPTWVIVAATAGLLAAAALGARRTGRLTWLLVLPAATTLAMVLIAAWQGYVRSGLPIGLHGRYLFTGLVGMATLAAVGVVAVADRLATPAALVLAAGLQTYGLWIVLDAYWAGGPVDRVRTMMLRSPWGDPTWALVGGIGATIGIAAVVALLRQGEGQARTNLPPA